MTRIEEILLFISKMGYKKIGFIFCMGFIKESRVVQRIFESHGLEVVSVGCKNGVFPKTTIDIDKEHTISKDEAEVMCNPIGQALMMNQAGVEFNVMMGLCVGHDSLVLKYLEAPVTILAVKDRVTGHSPMAPIYLYTWRTDIIRRSCSEIRNRKTTKLNNIMKDRFTSVFHFFVFFDYIILDKD